MATQTIDKNGNAVVDGYSTNLPPQTISTASMAPTTPVVVPPAVTVPTSTYTAPIKNTADSLATLQQQAVEAQKAEDQANAQSQNQVNTIAELMGSNVKDVAGTYASQGVNTAYNTLQDLASQATGLKNEASAIPIQNAIAYRGNAGVQSGVDTVSRDQLAQNALKALSLGQQYAIAEGNYNKAKSIADQMIETKYASEEARIKSLQLQQAAFDKYTLTPLEQKRLEAVKKATDLEAQQLAEKRANEQAVSKLIIEASPVAPADVLARAKDIQAKGGSPTEVALALGQYGGDYLKNLAYKSQLETDKAQRANVYDQIAVRNKEYLLKAKKYNDKTALLNFEAPPIVNAQTGKIDPKSALTSVIKSTGGKLKGGQAALDVMSAVQNLADRNVSGTFEGVGFGGGIVPERFKSQTAVSNRQDIEAIGLKVQQWASGASLTEKQTDMVEKFTPQLGDSDNAVKTKINGLVNFMMSQVSSDLAGQGINYNPEPIDMFSGIQSVDNKTFLGGIPSAPTDTTKLFDNRTFFDR